MDACVAEFGEHGFEKGSTDGIIRRGRISKGGLYEYMRSKEEIFLHVLDDCYARLYGYLKKEMARLSPALPSDILDRFQLASSVAVNFYIRHPAEIRLIAKSGWTLDPALSGKIRKIFLRHFLDLFGDVQAEGLRYGREKLLDLLRWLLAKTRNDFLAESAKKRPVSDLKKAYLQEWKFILGALRDGIYRGS